MSQKWYGEHKTIETNIMPQIWYGNCKFIEKTTKHFRINFEDKRIIETNEGYKNHWNK